MVTQLKIQIDTHTSRLDPLGQLKVKIQIVNAITSIDPQTLANRSEAGFSEDSLECLGLILALKEKKCPPRDR